MQIFFNQVFLNLYQIYSKEPSIPKEWAKSIWLDGSFGKGNPEGFMKSTNDSMGSTFTEDDLNHFHVVDDIVDALDMNGEGFMMGVTMLFMLGTKFKSNGLSQIRLWMTYETSEMAKTFAIKHSFYNKDDDCFANDRLSHFYKRGNENDVVDISKLEEYESAVMVIDI